MGLQSRAGLSGLDRTPATGHRVEATVPGGVQMLRGGFALMLVGRSLGSTEPSGRRFLLVVARQSPDRQGGLFLTGRHGDRHCANATGEISGPHVGAFRARLKNGAPPAASEGYLCEKDISASGARCSLPPWQPGRAARPRLFLEAGLVVQAPRRAARRAPAVARRRPAGR